MRGVAARTLQLYWLDSIHFSAEVDAWFISRTYTASFRARWSRLRYDYNQTAYRGRDERLNLPAPVYRMKSGDYRMRAEVTDWRDVDSIAWFALRGAQGGKRWESPYAMAVLDPDAPIQPTK
jgi:hypothetical protein